MRRADWRALGFEVKPDGPKAFVVTYRDAVAGYIQRSRKDKTLLRTITLRGVIAHVYTLDRAVQHIADNTY